MSALSGYIASREVSASLLAYIESMADRFYARQPCGDVTGFVHDCIDAVTDALPAFLGDTESALGAYIKRVMLSVYGRNKRRAVRYAPLDGGESCSPSIELDIALRRALYDFACRMYAFGVYVDQAVLYASYVARESYPILDVFVYLYMVDVIPESESYLPRLLALSRRVGLDEETALAVYALLGEKVFMLLHLLAGKRLVIPSRLSLRRSGFGRSKDPVLVRFSGKPDCIVEGDNFCLNGHYYMSVTKSFTLCEVWHTVAIAL